MIQSPVYELWNKNGIPITNVLDFSDTLWQDCPDTGQSTCGYKVFVNGGIVSA